MSSHFSQNSLILLLVESIKDDLVAKFPEKKNEIEQISLSSIRPNYLPWAVRQLNAGEPVEEVISMIKDFDRVKPRLQEKDLFQYETLGSLRDAIENSQSEKSKKRSEEKISVEGGYDVIYDDDDYVVVHPHTKEASIKYGKGTAWCVAATQSQNYFESYASNNTFLYYILAKNPSKISLSSSFEKIAYAIKKNEEDEFEVEIFNSSDDQIDESDVRKYLDTKYEKIHAAIFSDVKNRKDTEFNKKISNTTTEEFQSRLSKIKNVKERNEFKLIFAKSKRTSKKILSVLSKDVDASVRWHVARNTSCPSEILSVLSKDADADVRLNVAQNTSCPPEILSVLSKDDSANVRCYVAKNTSCPPEILSVLSKNADADVRCFVAKNTSCPPEILSVLAKDKNVGVRCYVAGNTSCPPEILSVLSKDADDYVRWNVARNTSCPTEILSVLSKDADADDYVRYCVAENTSCPTEILSVLSKDADAYVRQTALKNKNFQRQNENKIYEQILQRLINIF